MCRNFFKIRNYRRADFDNYVQLNLETNRLDRSGRFISSQRLVEELDHPNYHPENDLFVAVSGNRIYSGHWAQTYHFEKRSAQVEAIYQSHRIPQEVTADYVWAEDDEFTLPISYRNEQITIYRRDKP